jgi:DNA-3-methyladenine glycosylase I
MDTPSLLRHFHFSSSPTHALKFLKEMTRISPRRRMVVKKTVDHKIKIKSDNHVPSQQNTSDSPWYSFFTKGDPIYNQYMANEWGHEKRGDQELFEKLCLEGAQSGLSWRTILNKREAYRDAFHNFDIETVSRMNTADVERILQSEKVGNDMVVRHKGKLESVIHNAKQVLLLKDKVEQYTNFTDYLWGFVQNKPILNAWNERKEIPSKTEESEAMSKELKRHGFKFVGPTTCYSLMQSSGFVIDHPASSDEWKASFERLQKRQDGYQDRRKLFGNSSARGS